MFQDRHVKTHVRTCQSVDQSGHVCQMTIMRSLKSLAFKVYLPMLTMASRTEWAWKMGLKASQDLHESLSNSAIPPVKRQDRLTAGKLEKYLAPRLQVQQNQFCWWFQPSLIFPSSVCHCNPNLQKKSRASCQKKPGYLVYIKSKGMILASYIICHHSETASSSKPCNKLNTCYDLRGF